MRKGQKPPVFIAVYAKGPQPPQLDACQYRFCAETAVEIQALKRKRLAQAEGQARAASKPSREMTQRL